MDALKDLPQEQKEENIESEEIDNEEENGIDERVAKTKRRGIIGKSSVGDIWAILDEVDGIVPWMHLYPGSPNLSTVWDYVAPQLKTESPYLYRHLKNLIAETGTYNFVNFYLLR